jgi:hypothetical protein
MKKIVLAIALVCLSSVAVAKTKTPPPAQNHSCVLSGAVVEKTKKECIKAGGKWEKNSPAATTEPVAPKVDAKPAETPVTK